MIFFRNAFACGWVFIAYLSILLSQAAPSLAQNSGTEAPARVATAIETGKPLIKQLEEVKAASAKAATELLEIAKSIDDRAAAAGIGRILALGLGASQTINEAVTAAQKASQALQAGVASTPPTDKDAEAMEANLAEVANALTKAQGQIIVLGRALADARAATVGIQVNLPEDVSWWFGVIALALLGIIALIVTFTPRKQDAPPNSVRQVQSWFILALLVGVAVQFVWLTAGEAPANGPSALVLLAQYLAISGAAVVTGGLFGFLFGIPRSVGTMPESSFAASPQAAPSPNLERVSDWLVTLILGATLVQLGNLPTTLWRFAGALSSTPGDLPSAGRILIVCLLIYYFVTGFLGLYLLTRLFLSRDLAGAPGAAAQGVLLENVKVRLRELLSVEKPDSANLTRQTSAGDSVLGAERDPAYQALRLASLGVLASEMREERSKKQLTEIAKQNLKTLQAAASERGDNIRALLEGVRTHIEQLKANLPEIGKILGNNQPSTPPPSVDDITAVLQSTSDKRLAFFQETVARTDLKELVKDDAFRPKLAELGLIVWNDGVDVDKDRILEKLRDLHLKIQDRAEIEKNQQTAAVLKDTNVQQLFS